MRACAGQQLAGVTQFLSTDRLVPEGERRMYACPPRVAAPSPLCRLIMAYSRISLIRNGWSAYWHCAARMIPYSVDAATVSRLLSADRQRSPATVARVPGVGARHCELSWRAQHSWPRCKCMQPTGWQPGTAHAQACVGLGAQSLSPGTTQVKARCQSPCLQPQ